MQLPSVGVIALRGRITHSDGKTVLSGKWAMEGREFTKRRPCTEAFSYVNEQSSANDYSGDYFGGFMYGGRSMVDNDLTLFFVPNNGGSHNVNGSGVNDFGCFDIIGVLDQNGAVDMCRTYQDQDGGVDMCRTNRHAVNTLSVSRSDNEDSDSESEVDSIVSEDYEDYLPGKEQASAGGDGGDVDMSLILKKSTKRSIRKALGGGGAIGRGGEKKKSGGVKKSGGGKITLSYLIQNLHSMPRQKSGLYKANEDLGIGQRCLMSKKSNNGSGHKACACVGAKACNVKNCEDFIAYMTLPENEKALLGPPGRPGTCKLLLFIIHLYHMIIYSFCSHIISPSILL